MNLKSKVVIVILFIASMNNFCDAVGPVNPYHKEIKWKIPQKKSQNNGDGTNVISFEGAFYKSEDKGLPTYTENFYFNKKNEEPVVELVNQKFEVLAESNLIANKNLISKDIKVNSKLVWFKKSN